MQYNPTCHGAMPVLRFEDVMVVKM